MTAGLTFTDAAGVEVGAMPAPYAVDSTPDEHLGSGHTTTAVSYALGTQGSKTTVTVRVDDAAWLRSAVYPIYVDPSITIYSPGSTTYGDTFINQGNASMNYANYARPDTGQFEMWLGQSPAPTTDVNRDGVRFDLSAIAGTSVDTAVFQLYPYHQYYNSPTTETAYLRRITSSWTETGATWSNPWNYTTTGTVTVNCAEGALSVCRHPVGPRLAVGRDGQLRLPDRQDRARLPRLVPRLQRGAVAHPTATTPAHRSRLSRHPTDARRTPACLRTYAARPAMRRSSILRPDVATSSAFTTRSPRPAT